MARRARSPSERPAEIPVGIVGSLRMGMRANYLAERTARSWSFFGLPSRDSKIAAWECNRPFCLALFVGQALARRQHKRTEAP